MVKQRKNNKPAKKNTAKTKSKRSAKSSQPRRWWHIIGLCGLIVVLVFAWILSQSLFKTYPLDQREKAQWLNIEDGQTYSSFIQKLQKKGVRFPWVLKIYQKVFIHRSLKAGVYQVQPGMSVRQVLQMMSDVDNSQMNRVAVIEGTTFKQLKQQLKKNPYVKNTLLDQSDSEILRRIGATETHPEGLFAPNTYFFNKGESDEKILKRLYDEQKRILQQAWDKRAANLPYQNAYDALIMASIVEKETAVDHERQQVAGVFIRRLQKGMRLQTDPTVIYGMGERYHGNISKQDLRTPTPYNTYTHKGLPPTPIALPSKQSIEAALHPDQSNNLYFVATGKGGHTFSATLEAHNQAVQQYLQAIKK